METFSIIMAGGSGTRFWPISRKNKPKQYLNLSGKNTMITETINRLKPITKPENIIIVTAECQKNILKETVDSLFLNNCIYEPTPRNTSACVGLVAVTLKKKLGDAVMCIVPSDHYIKDEKAFNDTLQKASDIAKKTDRLVVIGMKPTYPCTGYGYINKGEYSEEYSAYNVKGFVEKPGLKLAEEYVASNQYLWNSGMFVWKISTILREYKRSLPDIYDDLIKIESLIGTDQEDEIKLIYDNIENISIDYGIMEKTTNSVVLPGDFGWSDVGSWESIETFYDKDDSGNISIGDNLLIETNNSVVYSKDHLVATIGLEDVVVVHTEDATLVCRKEMAQNIKEIIKYLNLKNLKYLI